MAWPARKDQSNLKVALALSAALHAGLLCVHFANPARWEPQPATTLAVLVNSSTKKAPAKATAIAQAHLDGGGTLDDKGWRPASPLERGPTQIEPEKQAAETEQERKARELERSVSELLARAKASRWSAPDEAGRPNPAAEQARKQALDLAAQIDARAQAYASRPKKAFVGLQTARSDMAPWIEAWQRKVEGVGSSFYPQGAAKGRRGSLILTAAIRKDGSVEGIKIDQSSGDASLDAAAQRILALAAPFEAFGEPMASRVDVLYVTRQWRFGPAGLERLDAEP
jgi:protein TonB